MVQIGRTNVGKIVYAVISYRTITAAEYKKLTDKELAFLLGLTGTDAEIDLEEYKKEFELVFEIDRPVKIISQENDKAKEIKRKIDKLQEEYKSEVGNNKKLVGK